MKLKNITALICSVLIIVALGVGISILYSDYIYSPIGDFVCVYVSDKKDPGYIDGDREKSHDRLFSNIDKWAEENNATVLYKNYISSGYGVICHSNWIDGVLGGQEYSPDGVYVADKKSVKDAYVSGDVLLLASAGLKINGYYDPITAPPVISEFEILYPLGYSLYAEGLYYTDADDYDGFVSLMNMGGYNVELEVDKDLSAGEIFSRLWNDNTQSRTLIFAMFALIFCFAYIILALFKSCEKEIWIRYLFGMSRGKLALTVALTALCSLALSVALFWILFSNMITYVPAEDNVKIFFMTVALAGAMTAVVYLIGYIRLSRSIRMRGEGK